MLQSYVINKLTVLTKPPRVPVIVKNGEYFLYLTDKCRVRCMQAPPVKLYLALNLVDIPQMLVYLFIYIIFSSYSLNNNYFLSLIIFLFFLFNIDTHT